MKTVPDYYIKRLGALEGYLPDGKTPKLRLVFGPEARRPHGKLQGTPKYLDPNTGKVMEFWVVECWYPPEMLGSRDKWQYDLLGPYPADCNLDCCRGGFYGFRMPITVNGEYLELTESVLHSIEQKQYADFQWSLLSEVERQKVLDASLSERNKQADADAFDEYITLAEDFAINKETLDNADNRVFSFAEKHGIVGKGLKEPIGRPKL